MPSKLLSLGALTAVGLGWLVAGGPMPRLMMEGPQPSPDVPTFAETLVAKGMMDESRLTGRGSWYAGMVGGAADRLSGLLDDYSRQPCEAASRRSFLVQVELFESHARGYGPKALPDEVEASRRAAEKSVREALRAGYVTLDELPEPMRTALEGEAYSSARADYHVRCQAKT